MDDNLHNLPPLLADGTFISILAIVLSVLSIGVSIVNVILIKKTNERDNARIAREDAAAAAEQE